MSARYLVGDVFDRLAQLPDRSVDLVLTSPPFLALRSYLPPDHPDKHREIGSEPTPATYLDVLLRLTAEWGRVLAPHGSIAVELGDTYAGSGGAGGDYNADGLREGQQHFNGSASRNRQRPGGRPPGQRTGRLTTYQDLRGNPDSMRDTTFSGANTPPGHGPGWPLDKSLCGIPTLYAWSLAYGRNLLTGQESPVGAWRVRNLVAWVRPNPPVGRLSDKFRPATSYLTVATRARDRWFDLDAVRTPTQDTRPRTTNGPKNGQADSGEVLGHYLNRTTNPGGAPPLDWWEIPPGGYRGAHYAVWPEALCERPIEAMCPRRVCAACGTPSRRITTKHRPTPADDRQRVKHANGQRPAPGRQGRAPEVGWEITTTTTGWTTCSCPGADGLRSDGFHTGQGWRPGVVLDCFAGTGTTLAVAHGHGRAAVGIDLDARNAELARARLGMFLTVEAEEVPTSA